MTEESFFEKFISKAVSKYREYKAPFLSSLIAGFIAYGFFFTNKLIQQDDAAAMFAKGASLTSGRWGLDIMSLIYPDFSMPWVYGIITLVILSLSSCIIISCVRLENKVLQGIFSMLFTTLSTVTGMFCLPFLATSYATAAILSVLSVYFIDKNKAVSIVLLALSISIYQAYIALAAGILVVVLIKRVLIENEDAKDVIKDGVIYVLFLALSVIAYFAVTLILNKVFGVELITYGTSEYKILKRIRVAYTAFAGFFYKGYFSLIPSDAALVFNIIAVALAGYAFVSLFINLEGTFNKILSAVLLVLLPLAINCMYLASSVDVLGALVFHSFSCMYLLICVLFDGRFKTIRGTVSVFLTLAVICNIYFANEISLKMYLQTSEVKAFYEGVISAAISDENYVVGDEIAIIGDETDASYISDAIDSSNFKGLTAEDPYNMYTRNEFIELYLGFKGPFAGYDRRNYLSSTDEFKSMAQYPEDGSIKKIDGSMVIKLQ